MTSSISASNDHPSVTVLLASYNRLELLKAAVDSAFHQQYPNYDVVVVDDGSNYETVEWLRLQEATYSNLSVYYREHQGVASARAYGVNKSEAEYICILDSDDILSPRAIDLLVNALILRSDNKIAFSDIREVRSNGSSVVRQYRQYNSARAMAIATMIKPRVPFKHTGTLFRRDTARELGSYDTRLPCKVDIDLYLKFMKAGYLPVHVNEPLVDFRMHKDSVSINRMLGIKVWFYLIEEYGPENPVYKLAIKIFRVGVEVLKRLYMEVRG